MPRPPTSAAALLITLLLLAACTGAGSAPGAAQPGASEAAGGGDGDQGGDAPGEADGFATLAEQRIIKTGDISIEVDNVAAALARVRALAAEVGGYVGGSQAGTLEQSATLTLRVPASRFEEALSRLRELGGRAVAESTREEDVTTQIVDLGARIANLEASEASYRVLAERAERVEDVLAVQARLDEVRGEIEQLRAQLETVSDRADLSTLTVTLIPRATPVEQQAAGWDPGARTAEAVAALVAVGQAALSAVIWIGIVVLPIVLVLAILVLAGLRVTAAIRRRLPPGPTVERADP